MQAEAGFRPIRPNILPYGNTPYKASAGYKEVIFKDENVKYRILDDPEFKNTGIDLVEVWMKPLNADTDLYDKVLTLRMSGKELIRHDPSGISTEATSKENWDWIFYQSIFNLTNEKPEINPGKKPQKTMI